MKQFRRVTGILFVILGLGLLIASGSLLIYNQQEAEQADEAAEAAMESLSEAIEERIHTREPEESSMYQDPLEPEVYGPMDTVEIDGILYIGYLSIPALDLDLPVMSEWSYEGLNIAPGRFYGDPRTHDFVIAAHNYTRHFGSLNRLSPGDTILFTDVNDHIYTYKVEDLEILPPDAVKEMTSGSYDLSLFTCTYDGRTRLTVRCMETDPQ